MTLMETIEQAAELVGGRPLGEGKESDVAYGRRVVLMLTSRIKFLTDIRERLENRLDDEGEQWDEPIEQ